MGDSSEYLRDVIKEVRGGGGGEWTPPWSDTERDNLPIPQAERIVKAYTAHGPTVGPMPAPGEGDIFLAMLLSPDAARAPFYSSDSDTVSILPRSRFSTSEAYYFGLFHELAHSTGRAGRLNRAMHNSQSDERPLEEVTADMAAQLLAKAAGFLTPGLRAESVKYIAHWSGDVLPSRRASFLDKARRQAEAAANYVLGHVN